MALNNRLQRGAYGVVITEAAVIPPCTQPFRDLVNTFDWAGINQVYVLEDQPVGALTVGGAQLNSGAIADILGMPNPDGASNEQVRAAVTRDLDNRLKIFALWKAGIAQASADGTWTPFLRTPLDVVQAAGDNHCVHPADGGQFTLRDLMTIFHMFGKNAGQGRPRPLKEINDDDWYFGPNDQAGVANELQRRIKELLGGINWEGKIGNMDVRQQGVWHRIGWYCGCG